MSECTLKILITRDVHLRRNAIQVPHIYWDLKTARCKDFLVCFPTLYSVQALDNVLFSQQFEEEQLLRVCNPRHSESVTDQIGNQTLPPLLSQSLQINWL